MIQKNERIIKEMASSRIDSLFKLAKIRARESGGSRLSKRYIKIAREISRHYKIKLPVEMRNGTCKKCNNVLVPGLNCKVRISSVSKAAIYKCECGEENRIYLRK
jgi:RNase P subunit RPR2